MSQEKPPSSAHLQWVIEGRAKNQKTGLAIYEMMKKYKNEIKADRGLSTEIQDLTAVAFSLWRAVFLADRSGETEAKLLDAEYFLSKMLTDNAIAFTQDRKAREWTFNYYVDNAWYRLKDLGQQSLSPPAGQRNPKNRWDYLQRALQKATADLANKLKANKRSR